MTKYRSCPSTSSQKVGHNYIRAMTTKILSRLYRKNIVIKKSKDLHQWVPGQVHVEQYVCPTGRVVPLSRSRLAPAKKNHKYPFLKIML
jgi:hypothetical protein